MNTARPIGPFALSDVSDEVELCGILGPGIVTLPPLEFNKLDVQDGKVPIGIEMSEITLLTGYLNSNSRDQST